MRKSRRRSPFRRALKAVIRLLLGLLALSILLSDLPFLRAPALTDREAVEARAEQMMKDVETADRAEILESRMAALDERIRMMARAESEIVITTYECHDGESTRDLLAVACHMAKQGVRVRFLADGLAGWLDVSPNPLFQAAASCPNVEMRFYNYPSLLMPWRFNGRMHDKYVIVDDMAYILGGRNMYDGFLGEYPTNRHLSQDREALVYNAARGTADSADSSLFELKDYFEGIWNQAETMTFTPAGGDAALLDELEARYEGIVSAKPELFGPYDYAAVTLETKGIWLISNPTGIYAKEPVVFEQLCALMSRAKREVVVHSPYAVLNRHMHKALTDIAAKVPVTLMVNAVGNGANVAAGSDFLFHRASVEATGVKLMEYAGGISYHGKSLAIDDDLSVIGSYNLDLRSTYIDTELMLVIRGEAVNGRLREHMAALHADCVGQPGVSAPERSVFRRAGLWALGCLLQLFRNLL